MELISTATFADSLARLTGSEQRAVTAALDIRSHPSQGFRLHKIETSRGRSLLSVRAGRDIRIIAARCGSGLHLCYAGHHEDAYRWAAGRRAL